MTDLVRNIKNDIIPKYNDFYIARMKSTTPAF